MSLGKKIKEARKAKNMTQENLAEKLDVSVQTVSAWETGTTPPKIETIKKISNVLGISFTTLCEDSIDSGWELNDALFSVENMKKKVTEYARNNSYTNTLTAIRVMEKYHEGQTRKGYQNVPYIIHPLTMACHAIALSGSNADSNKNRIADDKLLSAILLHDVLEDTEAKETDLGVDEEIVEIVKLLTNVENGIKKNEELYYAEIGKNKIASMVKILDRCNNLSMMATAFDREKMVEYIMETEKYIMPLLDNVKHEYFDYYNAAFLIKYQMKSTMENLKRVL